jgi:hypothetical protein
MRSYESQTAGGDRRLPLVMQHPVADAARYATFARQVPARHAYASVLPGVENEDKGGVDGEDVWV